MGAGRLGLPVRPPAAQGEGMGAGAPGRAEVRAGRDARRGDGGVWRENEGDGREITADKGPGRVKRIGQPTQRGQKGRSASGLPAYVGTSDHREFRPTSGVPTQGN